jgi:hypothetical protein
MQAVQRIEREKRMDGGKKKEECYKDEFKTEIRLYV